jgi:hypothetical protein
VSTAIASQEFSVLAESEEIPMTMQVGMVGTDGILLASDKLWTQNPILSSRRWAVGRRSFIKSKIKINNESRIAVSCAIEMDLSCDFADKVLARLQVQDFTDPIPKILEIASEIPSTERGTAQCLIALVRPSPRLFWFQSARIDGDRIPICERLEPIAIAGDNLNPSIFWAEKYCRIPRSIDALIPIAAHLIIGARQFNNAVIDGLEIVRCRESGIHHLSDTSIDELKGKVADWDRKIDRLFLRHRQEYTDEPPETALS